MPQLPIQTQLVSTIAVALLFSGCSLIPQSLLLPLMPVKSNDAEAARYQEMYLETGDPKAIGWLLKHQIRTGMTVGDINRIIGQDGVRVYGSQEMLRNTATYREDDQMFRWGPDKNGQTYLLVFRGGKLVNYDAHLYNESDTDIDW